MSPRLESAWATHVGLVRSNNEDTALCDAGAGLWLVADGMGGHEAGEVASAIARDEIPERIATGMPLPDAVNAAHLKIIEAVGLGQGKAGMGCTVVAISASSAEYEVAWVGDSRAYRLPAHGQLRPLTTDHSYVQSLYQAGVISKEELATHPDKNIITQCLGSTELEQLQVDTLRARWEKSDRLLLCSDGLTDIVNEAHITLILRENAAPQAAADALVEAALASGGKDNITVVVVDGPAMVSQEHSQHGAESEQATTSNFNTGFFTSCVESIHRWLKK